MTSVSDDEITVSAYEEALQRRAVKWLDEAHPRMLRHGTLGNKLAGTAAQRKRRGYLNKLAGFKKGWPDLVIVKRGNSRRVGLAVEFKRAGGRQTKEQKDVQQEMEAEGWTYALVHSLQEFQSAVALHMPVVVEP